MVFVYFCQEKVIMIASLLMIAAAVMMMSVALIAR